jgi:hypothetical protein
MKNKNFSRIILPPFLRSENDAPFLYHSVEVGILLHFLPHHGFRFSICPTWFVRYVRLVRYVMTYARPPWRTFDSVWINREGKSPSHRIHLTREIVRLVRPRTLCSTAFRRWPCQAMFYSIKEIPPVHRLERRVVVRTVEKI